MDDRVTQLPMKPNTTNPATIRKRLAAYRKEHFAVIATPPEKEGETVTVAISITSNGKQWQTIGLMPEEIQRVIDALTPFLPNEKVSSDQSVGIMPKGFEPSATLHIATQHLTVRS